jgi:hypothetical protein
MEAQFSETRKEDEQVSDVVKEKRNDSSFASTRRGEVRYRHRQIHRSSVGLRGTYKA